MAKAAAPRKIECRAGACAVPRLFYSLRLNTSKLVADPDLSVATLLKWVATDLPSERIGVNLRSSNDATRIVGRKRRKTDTVILEAMEPYPPTEYSRISMKFSIHNFLRFLRLFAAKINPV